MPPTSYLLDLGRRNLDGVDALKLLHLVENHSADVQVQSHADGVRRDKDVKAVVGLVEQLGLVPAHLWRQCPIYNTTLVAGPPLDVRFDVEDIPT